jgi:hypothetical protein
LRGLAPRATNLSEDARGGQVRVDELQPARLGPNGPFAGGFPDPLPLSRLAIPTPIVVAGRAIQARPNDRPFRVQVEPPVEEVDKVQVEHVISGTDENDVWPPRHEPLQSSRFPEVPPIVDFPPLVFVNAGERAPLQVHGATQAAELVSIDGIHPTFAEVVGERALARSGWTSDKNPSRAPTCFAPHVERAAPRVMNLPGRPGAERGERGLRSSRAGLMWGARGR